MTGQPGSAEKAAGPPSRRPALVVAVAVVAFNLRPAIASVAPVLLEIQRSTGLSSTAAGLLTTLPVFAFGACAPLAPLLGRRFPVAGCLAVWLARLRDAYHDIGVVRVSGRL